MAPLVCYYCGYPYPGPHAGPCRDRSNSVVTVTRPVAPIEFDVAIQKIRAVELVIEAVKRFNKVSIENDISEDWISRFTAAQDEVTAALNVYGKGQKSVR